MVDTLQLVKEREKDFDALYQRMDKDADRIKQINEGKFTLKNVKGQPIKDAVNITLNDEKVFGEHSLSIVNNTFMQTIVTGNEITDEEAVTLEDFDKDIRWEIDKRLLKRGLYPLDPFLTEQICYRGVVAVRYTSREDKGKFIPDLLPVDTRYLVYDYTSDGLDFASAKFTRRKNQIARDYPDIASGLDISKLHIVRDFWDSNKEEIYINDVLAKVNPHNYGEPPFIIEKSGLGTMMQDADSLEYSAESIFAPNRLLQPEMNRLASILATINYMIVEGAYQYASREGSEATPPDYPNLARGVTSVDMGGGITPIPINDIKNATRLLWSILSLASQRGSLPNIDYGNLTFPLSAVAIGKLTSSKDAIYLPRLDAISRLYYGLFRMATSQYIKGGKPAELGEEGLKKEYKIKEIDKQFAIQYKFFPTSPEQEIANHALAAQATHLSVRTKLTEIIKVADPIAEIDQMRDEAAERNDIAITLYRRGRSLIQQADRKPGNEHKRVEAELVLQQLEITLRQRQQGQGELTPGANFGIPGIEPPLGSQRPSISLMAGGQGGNGGKPNEDEGLDAEEGEERAERRDQVVRKSAEES